MKKLVNETVSGHLHALGIILSSIASDCVRCEAVSSLREHCITNIGRAINELNEARERDIAAMQGQMTEVMEEVNNATSVLSDSSTAQIPDEFRLQAKRAARSFKKLQRSLPIMLTELEREELQKIYRFYDPLITKYEKLRKQFEKLKS